MMDISDTLAAKSDQLNADDLVGGPVTVKVTNVNKTSTDQPITIHYEGENGRPFKPCKTVRRILAKAWGKDATQWAGRSMTLFNEQSVKWAGKPVGGIRVSHLSHINGTLNISLSETRGMKKPHTIKALQTNAPTQGAPAQNTPPQSENTPPQTDNAPNIRLIKTDGSEVRFDNFQAWIDFMAANLPKITDLPRLETFATTHEQIFVEYTGAGWSEWVEKARAIISENRNRLENDNGNL